MDKELIKYIKDAFNFEKKGFIKQAISSLYNAISLDEDNPELLKELGRLHLQLQNFTNAQKFLVKALDIDPTNIEALALIIFIATRTDNHTLAIQMSQKLLEIHNSEESFVILLNVIANTGNYDMILQYYNLFNLKNSKNIDVMLPVIEAYYNLGKITEAQDLAASLYEENKTNYNFILKLSKIYTDQKLYQCMENMLLDFKDLYDYPDLLYYLALSKLNTGKYFEAVDIMSKVCLGKNLKSCYYDCLSQTYAIIGWFKEAIEAIKKAIELSPEQYEYNIFLAYLYYYTGKKTLSLIEIDYVLQKEPENLSANVLKILVEYQPLLIAQSKVKIDKLLQDNPELEFVLYTAFIIYRDLNLLPQAQAFLEAALIQNKKSYIYSYELAKLYLKTFQYDKAKKKLLTMIENKLSNTDVYSLLAEVYLQEKDLDSANIYISKVADANYTSSHLFYLQSYYYYLSNDLNKAFSFVKEAISLDLSNQSYYMLAGDILFKQEKYSDAFDFYSEILNFASMSYELLLKLSKSALKSGNIQKAEYFCSKLFAHEGIAFKKEYFELMKDLKLLDKVFQFFKIDFEDTDKKGLIDFIEKSIGK